MEKRNYQEVVSEIKRHWATEGMQINSGDDGFSQKVHSAMLKIGGLNPGMEKNKFFSCVYRLIKMY